MKFTNVFKKSNSGIKNQEKRIILLHFHIFKNAGSTIEWLLEKNFPKQNLAIDGKKPGDTILVNEIISTLRNNSSIKAVSSHQIRFPIPNNTEFEFIPILFIRHPIDRCFSIYYFKRKESDDSIGSIKARDLNLPEFIKWNLELSGYMPMKNFQVLFLSDKTTIEIVNETDLKLAITRMKSCKVLGVVERMNESLVLAEQILKKYNKKINLAYVPQNVSRERSGSIIERVKKEEQVIGKNLAERLHEHNKLDFLLYEETKKEMDRRISEIENFEDKLSDFRERCRKLANFS